MLNDKQTEIADYLLKYLEKNGGKSSLDDYPAKLDEKGFDYMDSWFVPDFLRDHLGLIAYWGEGTNWLTLTPEGYKASKVGLKKYLEQVEKEKQLELDSLDATVYGKKLDLITILVSTAIALITSIGVPLILNSVNNKADKIGYGQSNTKPTQGFNVNMIDSIKNSLKHDTVFLNEIKELIENQKYNNNEPK